MSVFLRLRKGLMAVAALGALALGGSALADAATSSSSTTGSSSSGSSTTQQQPQGRPPRDPTKPGGHRGANGQVEQALPSDVAAKVKAAAEAKVPGGTVERVETDVDHGSPYEAHVRKSDGTELEVLVNKDFAVTAVNTMQHP
jgi:uncharacterized membrane protein YkoI